MTLGKRLLTTPMFLGGLFWFVRIDGYLTYWGVIPGILIVLALDLRYSK